MNVEGLASFVSFSRLQYYPTELSDDGHLAIAGDSHLVIIFSSDQVSLQEKTNDVSSLVLEFDEDTGRPSVLSWIDRRVLCVGFETGLLSCFDINGEELFIFKGSTTSVRSLKTTTEKDSLKIWCLYEEGLAISMSFQQACTGKFDDAVGYKLAAQANVDDFIIYVKQSANGTSIFDDDAKDKLQMMVVGADNAVVIYDLSTSQNHAVDDGKSKDKSSSFSKSLYSIFSAMSGYSDNKKASGSGHIWSRSKFFYAQPLLVLNDEKRRVFRISLDPLGYLAATADSLGRVILYDLRSECAVRIWKGLRDARLSWLVDGDAVILAIYAPLLGLVSLYKMRHGACQRVIPVGLSLAVVNPPPMRVSLSNSLRFSAEKNRLEMIKIEAGVFSDSELEQVAQFVKDHQGAANEDASSWDENLRSSDMHASIQEVIEREQRLRRSVLHSGKELRRLLQDWVKQPNSLSEMQSIERAVLNVLNRSMPLKSLVSMLACIEVAELTGEVPDFQSISSDEIVLACDWGPFALSSNDFQGRFSIEFHRSMVDLIQKLENKEESTLDLFQALQQELLVRRNLLKGVTLLLSVKGSSSENGLTRYGDSSATLPPMQRDEATQICKQNTYRAEALCWTLRTMKKANSSLDSLSSKSPPGGNIPSTSISPAQVPVISPANSMDAVTGISPRRIVRVKSSTPPPQPLFIDSESDRSTGSSRSMINFSAFRMLFARNVDTICLFRSAEIHRFMDDQYVTLDRVEGFVSLAYEFSHRIGLDSGELSSFDSLDNTRISADLSAELLKEVLALLFHALLGDLVSLHSFSAALKVLNLADPLALKHLLPLFIHFLCKQSLQSLVADVLTKKMSVSPLQRWLRDHLLTFQDSFSSYTAWVNKAANSAEQSSTGDGEVTPVKSESSSDDFHSLALLSKDILEELAKYPTEVASPATLLYPSFDQCARYLFRSVWLQCRCESNLEVILAFSAVLLETLYIVNDQVERRTYGSDNLKTTIQSWENLVRHVRVLLFIQNRIYDHKNYDIQSSTVGNLSAGKLSIFRILAKDTLVFAPRAEQAREHENQCLEVYKRRIMEEAAVAATADTSTPVASSKQAQSDVLLAWGKVADKRWRDLITIAMNEDTLERSSSQDGSQRRRRKPLLLYFPDHNNIEALGAYRTIILAEKWADKIDKMETLALVCEHLCELPAVWRAVIALHVYTQFIIPVIQLLIDFEEDRSISVPSERRKQQLLNLMGEVALMNAFIRSSEEIVGYSLEGRTTTLSTFRTAAMNVVELYERYLVARPYRDEERQQIWPAPVDVALMNLFLSFHRDCSLEGSDTVFSAAAQFNVDVDSLQESGSSFEQWTADALSFQSTLLSVLQLRFLCGLRGVKPSQLLGPVVSDLLSLNLKLRDRLTPSTAWKELQASTGANGNIVQTRFEFLEQSTRRLAALQSPSTAVFHLSKQWSFSSDLTRLLVMKAIVEQTGVGNREEELGQMISHFEDKDLIMDVLISIVRFRLGSLITNLERHASTHGTLLASMDSEAMAWVKLAVTSHKGCSIAPMSFRTDDLSSARQLIIYIQGLLFAVPVNLRKQELSLSMWLASLYGSRDETIVSLMRSRVEMGLALSRYMTWLERKAKCDALLSLSNILLQAVQVATAATASRKK